MINILDKLFSNGSCKQTLYNSAKVSEINVLCWMIVALTTQKKAPKGSCNLCWFHTPRDFKTDEILQLCLNQIHV